MDTIVLIFLGFLAFLFVFSYLIPVRLWLAAQFSGASVSIFTLIGMRFRTVPPKVVVEPRMGNLPRLKSCDAEAPEPAQWFYAVRHEAHSVV